MRSSNSNNKYGKDRRDSGRPRFDSRDSRPHQMHDAVCADCKGDCKVPFMPSSGKPVFCSNCFEKRGNGNNNSRKPSYSRDKFSPRDSKPQVNYNKQFEIVNTKLDKIMKALNLE
jgi:CxxC-x17-CxxC domain-containing protein